MRRLLLATALAMAGPAAAQSLFTEDSWRGLIADNKAHRVGDVLTVQVFESSSATSSIETGTRRNNRVQAELSHRGSAVAQTTIAAGGEFDGGGRTQRTHRLLTTVTVTVREVLPGGLLRIAGIQSTKVNEELQQVTLEGLVRAIDISDGNVVQSTRISEARITYVGEGDVSERSRRPWWRRLADALGL
ncbi:MAG TPA: flagellar basal body L-ring protein FlgH [Ramlibacter sp.]|nr:flagellar basal body L-ring protein FlgH [Ramlibacter sp.]